MASPPGQRQPQSATIDETSSAARKDYDYYIQKYGGGRTSQSPAGTGTDASTTTTTTATSNLPSRNPHRLGVRLMEPVLEQAPMGASPRLPPIHPSSTAATASSTTTVTTISSDNIKERKDPEPTGNGSIPENYSVNNNNSNSNSNDNSDEALLDLAQLEELHHEAERMKALGNKHMAAQEYTKAYNAYSAALQLSPVGPSSHVFLSNRSAALLSLKRYPAAATDARRAIALAPTFGKAHARLGQALYFIKDYDGAVGAYEDAIHYEPDNSITKSYLEKAKAKADRQKEKQAKMGRNGEEVSVITETSSLQPTIVNSVATDPNAQAAVVKTMGFRGNSNAMQRTVGAAMTLSSAISVDTMNTEEDPDFDEALRIQERANRYLANKNYKYAIEEYTAALFLVPDDQNLSPDLHLGRAHALNGSRRHESAKIDATLALRIKPSPEAFSTLAKSLFYMRDYQGAVEAFGRCKDILPEGESLSMFDRAYLQKSELALQEAVQNDDSGASRVSTSSSSVPIPKLKPPRFVSREEQLSRTPNIPSMPKSWPQQSPRDSRALMYKEEREICFLSEALGIKLHRGPDGVVRVIEVSPEVPGSPIAREGKIVVGDVLREVAGVDLRRPITNIMWGDTVALIKMAPRPIVFVVAEELNPPSSILQQRKAAAANALSPTSAAQNFPSNSSGDESVREKLLEQRQQQQQQQLAGQQESSPTTMEGGESLLHSGSETVLSDPDLLASQHEALEETTTLPLEAPSTTASSPTEIAVEVDKPENVTTKPESCDLLTASPSGESAPIGEESQSIDPSGIDCATNATLTQKEPSSSGDSERTPVGDNELEMIGKDIFFTRSPNPEYGDWDNLRWMSYSGARHLSFVESISRFVNGRRTLFWSGSYYEERILAIYDNPEVILLLRPPVNTGEALEILDLPPGASVDDTEDVMKKILIVDSVIDPKTCKLKLSPLTTVTAIPPSAVANDDYRRLSCFELLTPVQTIILSSIKLRKGAERMLTSFTDSGAYFETTRVEHALEKSIFNAHATEQGSNGDAGLSWKHQIILGTLHCHAVRGDISSLTKALSIAREKSPDVDSTFVNPKVIDKVDETGRTALHYACASRFSAGVESLVRAGANADIRIDPYNMAPCHLAAMHLDSKSLDAILSAHRRPMITDGWGRTPMYLAIMDGKSVGGFEDPVALERCLSLLEFHGGQLETPLGFQHPVSALAGTWSYTKLDVVLRFLQVRFPLVIPDANDRRMIGISVSAFFQYPIHNAVIVLRRKIMEAVHKGDYDVFQQSDCAVSKTIEILLNHGFEPNERLEGLLESFDGANDLVSHFGFSPTQIVGATALDAMIWKDKVGDNAYLSVMKILSDVMYTLVRHGARLSLISPPLERITERGPVDKSTSLISTLKDADAIPFYTHDLANLKLKDNRRLIDLLGAARLASAEKSWKDSPTIASTGATLFHTDKLPIENSEAPGGSDTKSCAICWQTFGTISNRKHRCRVSRRHVCDECSTKRITDHEEEHRVSDGQFLLARMAVEESKKPQMKSLHLENTHSKSHTRTAEAEDAANRDSLFGNVMESMSKAVFRDEREEQDANTSDTIEGLSNSLSMTRNQLNERGEKLNTLADKSDRLVNASKDFASMAKELNKQTQGGFFW